jgi:rhodanese-related sulfurtransferase
MLNKNRWLALLIVALAGLALAACTTAAPPATVQAVTAQDIYARLPGDLDSGLILLDVRTPEEWAQDGHIEGAALIPLDELEARADELPADAEIVIYCRSGNRSAQAASLLIGLGYTDVADMGGINDWKALGYPVIYGP